MMREKSKVMWKRLLLLCVGVLLVALLGVALPARAQTEISLASLTIDLWPEFDRPTVLVMYNMTLASQVSLPAEVKLRIPTNGLPNAVAVCQADGQCFNAPYETRPQGTWTVVSLQATMPDIRLEYYDPGLKKDGPSRRYTYTWLGDYAADAVKVSVQQPNGAENMHTKPGVFNPITGVDGLKYYELNAGALEAGQTFQIEVDYQKKDEQLTYNNLPVAPSEPVDSTESGRASRT